MLVTIGAVAAHFGRDVDRGVSKVIGIVDSAATDGVELLVLPDACLGGYIGDLRAPDPHDRPPALDPDGPEIAAVIAAAGPMTVCVGYAEEALGGRYNAAICVSGDGVLGHHRKVHQPAGESLAYLAGDAFAAFDTPVGRLGMLIDYDKTFPESARALALDGAEIIAALSAWPTARTAAADRIEDDRWKKRFDLYDAARALDNQVVWAASNQTGTFGSLRFVGNAKIVGPGGDVRAETGVDGGLATVSLDVHAELAAVRQGMYALRDRRPDAYRLDAVLPDYPAGRPEPAYA